MSHRPLRLVAVSLNLALFVVGCGRTAPPGMEAGGSLPGEPVAETNPVSPVAAATPVAPAADKETAAVTPLRPEGLEAVIASHRGRVVLVDFWATWCVPCRKQFPHTVALSKEYVPGDLVVVAVSLDENDEETRADVAAFLREQGGRIEGYLSDEGPSEDAFSGFDIAGGALPHYQVFDRQGRRVAQFGDETGTPIDSQAIDAAVAAAVAQK